METRPKPFRIPPLALLLGGAGLGLSLPPFNLSGLAWVALVPLFVSARGRRPLEAAGLAILTSLLAGAVQVGFHPSPQAVYGGLIPFFWLALLLSLVTVLSGPAAARLPSWADPLWTAALAVTLEWATCLLPLPMTLALTQHRNLAVLPLASVTGAWGLSFLVWWTNAVLARGVAGDGLPRSAAGAGAMVALALAGLHLSRPAPGPEIRVAVVQDYVPGENAVAPAGKDPLGVPDREALTREAARRGARVAVWTERCLGTAFSPDDPADDTRRLARGLRMAVVPGYLSGGPGKPFNCAAWVGADGAVRGVHHKMHPFMDEAKTILPGRQARAFDTELGRVGLEICFDTCYPAVTRDLVRDGARLIAAPSIDPSVANGALHHLHVATLPLRAVENGVPFLRADPNGLSQIVDRDGTVRAAAALWEAGAPVATVHPGTGGTLYTRLGDWFPAVCALFCLLASPPGGLRKTFLKKSVTRT